MIFHTLFLIIQNQSEMYILVVAFQQKAHDRLSPVQTQNQNWYHIKCVNLMITGLRI